MKKYKYISPEEKKAKEEKKLKQKAKQKRFGKIVGFSLLGIFGVAVLAVLVTWITGGFSTKPIYITALTIEEGTASDNSTDGIFVQGNEVLIVGDKNYTTHISYEPEDSNQTILKVEIKEGRDVLNNSPKTVVAGRPFTLEFAKDEEGRPIGGKVELVFTDSSGLVKQTLKLLVDSPLKELTLSGNDLNKIGNKYALSVTKLNGTKSSLNLSAENSNEYYCQAGFVEFSNSFINNLSFKKTYYYTSNSQQLKLDSVLNNTTSANKTFEFYPLASGNDVSFTTFTHKTFIMQNAFKDEWIETIMNGNIADYDFSEFNAFINTYYSYIATNEEAELFFADNTNPDTGLIEFANDDLDTLKQSLNYIFVINKAEFIISDIVLSKINTEKINFEANIFDIKNFDVNTISVDEQGENDNYFGLSLQSETNSTEDNEILKSRMKDVLIAPYVNTDIDYGLLGDNEKNKTVNTNGFEYFKYLYVNNITYVYDDTCIKVNKSLSNNQTLWSFEALRPVTSNVVLISYLQTILNNGDIEYTYAQPMGVRITYTQSSIAFDNTSYKIALNHDLTNADRNNIILNSVDINFNDLNKGELFSQMEYKRVLWFVPALAGIENIISPLEEHELYSTYDNAGVLEIQRKIVLCDMEGERIKYNDANEFYLIGEGNSLTISPKYASNNNIPLFAMVMQTSLSEGLGDVVSKSIASVDNPNVFENAYCVVTYTNTPAQISVTKYLDTLYVYVKQSGTFMLANSADANITFAPGESGEFYISSIPLNENGTPVTENANETQANLIALNNYLTNFGKACVSITEQDYRLNEVFQAQSSELKSGENYITYSFTINTQQADGSFNLNVQLFEAGTSEKPYVADTSARVTVKINIVQP